MCKFCETSSERVLVTKRSRKGRCYSDYEERIVNPKLNDAEWTSNDEEGFSIMDTELDVEKKKLMFFYNAYSCDSSFSSELKIEYCPFCGRKL